MDSASVHGRWCGDRGRRAVAYGSRCPAPIRCDLYYRSGGFAWPQGCKRADAHFAEFLALRLTSGLVFWNRKRLGRGGLVVGHDCRGRPYSSAFAVALSLALAINDLGPSWLTAWGGSTLVELGLRAMIAPSNGLLHAIGFDSSGKLAQRCLGPRRTFGRSLW